MISRDSYSQYISAFIDALDHQNVDLMYVLLEEEPSLVEHPDIEERLSIAYTVLLRYNPSFANSLYQAVNNSNIREKEKYIKRFKTLDILDALKDHPIE